MSELFYDIAQKLDNLKKKEIPSNKDIEKLSGLLSGPEYTRYFFHNFSSPGWVEPLHEQGWFLNSPAPLEDEDQQGYFSMPKWHEGEYLLRMADRYPEVVREVAIVLKTENSRAIRTMLKALLKIPPNNAAEAVSVFDEWLNTPFVSFMSLSHEIGQIMEYLMEGNQAEAALKVLKSLSSPISIIESPAEGKVIAGTRHDYYFLQQAFENNLPVLIEKDPVGVAKVIEEQLKGAIDLETDPKIIEDDVRLKSYWRFNINPNVGESYRTDIKNLLADTLINALGKACEQGLNSTEEILEGFIQSKYSILRRIGIFTLRAWGDQHPELLERVYLRNVEEPIIVEQSEFNRLIDNQFNNLPENIRHKIIEAINGGPSPEWVQNLIDRHPDEPEGITEQEKRETLIDRWKLREYDRTAQFLEGEEKLKYGKLLDKYGKPQQPQEGVIVTSWEGPESPHELTELSSKSVNEVIQLLVDFSPKEIDTFGLPSREGLARTFEEDVLQRPDDYVNNMSGFLREDLPFVYHTHLLWGLSKIVNQYIPDSIEDIISLCEFLVSKEEDVLHIQEYEPGIESTKRAVADYLEKLLSVLNILIDEIIIERIGNIFIDLINEDAPSLEREPSFDPAARSINIASGIALHGLVKYGLYLNRMHIKDQEGNVVPMMAEQVKEVLTKQLNLQQKPSLALHSVFGWYFPQLFYLDKEWVSDNINNIFPLEKDLNEYRRAAWDAYIRFSQVYVDVFPKLIPQYEKAIAEIADIGIKTDQDRETGKLGTHILWAYTIGLIDLESQDNLIKSYYHKADAESRAQNNFWLSRFLEAKQPSAEDDTWKRIMSLWLWRLNEAKKYDNADQVNKEIASFSRLLKHSPLELDAMHPILEQMLNYKAEGFEFNLIIEYLGKNCAAYPAKSISLLHKIVTTRRKLYLTADIKNIVKDILVASLDTDDETKNKIIEIINVFGKRGDYQWRDLLSELS